MWEMFYPILIGRNLGKSLSIQEGLFWNQKSEFRNPLGHTNSHNLFSEDWGRRTKTGILWKHYFWRKHCQQAHFIDPCKLYLTVQNRVFRKLTDLTFLSFLYKINITGFENQQKKIASTGYWTHNTNPTIEIPATLPTQPICQSMSVSNFQTLIKSCSIEPEMIQVQFMNLVFNRCLCGWMGKVARILIVGLVLWVQYPVEAIFFCWFWNPVMLILYKNDRNVRSVNLRKTRIYLSVIESIIEGDIQSSYRHFYSLFH